MSENGQTHVKNLANAARGGEGVKLPPPPCLKPVRIMLETSNFTFSA